MNIFLTNKDPKLAARDLDDLRLNKMILETGQILSQAFRRLFRDDEILYKDTHLNHPCCIWARKNYDNYHWLFAYFVRLNEERIFRTGKVHNTFEKLFFTLSLAGKLEKLINFNKIEFDFNCTENKQLPVVDAYRHQLIIKWNNDKRLPKWTNREIPSFYTGRYPPFYKGHCRHLKTLSFGLALIS